MKRLLTLVWILAIGGTSAALFHISYRVESMEDRLSRLNGRIVAEQESIRVLRAEWAYLNRPERLGRLVEQTTALAPMAPDQIIDTVRVIPAPLPGLSDPADAEVLMTLVEVEGFGQLPMPPRRPGSRSTGAPAPAGARPAERAPETPAPAEGQVVPVSARSEDPMGALIQTVGADSGNREATR